METDFIVRASVLVLLALSFGISGYFRGKARREKGIIPRQEEGWLAVILRIGLALPLLLVILLNIFIPSSLGWAKIPLPPLLQGAGLLIAFLCPPLFWWTFRSIGGNISETVLVKADHELVTSGPYRLVRHPLYASALLLLTALGLIFRDWIILGYTLIGILAFRLLVIPAEEKLLLESFGEEYECYQSRTGALVPWIR
jgi:protein-S-isoprenylcysteine O-methyltransferase Ste14